MELHTSKYSKPLIALKKYMIDYFKHFHRQMTILLSVPYQDKSNILSITHPLIIIATILTV